MDGPLAVKNASWYNDAMTELQRWKRSLGEAGYKRLSPAWKRHIKRIDALPKPIKPIPLRLIREYFGN